LFQMRLQAGCEAEFETLAAGLTRSTHAEDEGCITYTFHRRTDAPREVMLYEQWPDADALDAHIRRPQREMDPADDQEPFPEKHHRRRLSKSFLDFFEKTDVVRYDVIA
jgi:quinol monooxygenase YgiN